MGSKFAGPRVLWGHKLSGTALIKFLECRYIPEPNTGCWLWTVATLRSGYGCFTAGKRRMTAHRAAFLAWKGPIPEGMFVLHSCDQPSCINPQHLRLGTHADNTSDKNARNRNARGERIFNKLKLTPEKVLEIRRLSREGVRGTEIAKRFAVYPGAIYAILKHITWKHV